MADKVFGKDFMSGRVQDLAYTLIAYAGFWARQGKNLSEALAAAKKAVEILPTSDTPWSTLSLVQEKMNNLPEAIKAKEKAIELAPDSMKEAYKKQLEKLKGGAPAKK
jgi:tetratricopeptide (TPR) repeat protein